MITSITSSNITDDQKKQIKRLMEDAVVRVFNDGGLDEDGAQKLIGNGDKLQARVICAIRELSVPNEFADEEVDSTYGYLSGYKPNRDQTIELIIADFEKQAGVLDGLFNCGKRFNPDWIVRVHPSCPQWVEKFFANLDWRKIGKTYEEALQKALDLIKQTRDGALYNYREGQLGPQNLRQSAKALSAYEKLCSQQKDRDILVVPCQFGLRHRGRSVRRAREVMPACEFGLGTFEVGIMLLTHPERLQHYDDLWINLAGDEFSDVGGDSFGRAPFFGFRGDGVMFDTDDASDANDYDGSASAFLPQ